jgi:RNA polymerase sigma factor (sigma-70 family)
VSIHTRYARPVRTGTGGPEKSGCEPKPPLCPLRNSVCGRYKVVIESPVGIDLALDRARKGDPRGFEALFRTHANAVFGYLRARGVSDPEGLANEVFVRAFRNIHTVHGDGARFRSWLFGIAHNAAVDDLRRRRRRPAESPLGEDLAVAGGNVESEAIASLQSDLVRRILGELAPDQRDVLLLRVIGDLSVSQTAAVLDKSYEAVKALQRRGIAALRRRLEANEGVPR